MQKVKLKHIIGATIFALLLGACSSVTQNSDIYLFQEELKRRIVIIEDLKKKGRGSSGEDMKAINELLFEFRDMTKMVSYINDNIIFLKKEGDIINLNKKISENNGVFISYNGITGRLEWDYI